MPQSSCSQALLNANSEGLVPVRYNLKLLSRCMYNDLKSFSAHSFKMAVTSIIASSFTRCLVDNEKLSLESCGKASQRQ